MSAVTPVEWTGADSLEPAEEDRAGIGPVALFLRDVAELEPASPEAEDSIIISVGDLEIIAERHLLRREDRAD